MAGTRALWAGGALLLAAGCTDAGPPIGEGAGWTTAAYGSADRWFSPSPGVRCDRLARVCYDRHGPELSLTREQFGRAAAKDLAERIGGNWRTDTTYTPEKGVKCDTADELCLKRGEVDYKTTREQFGRKPALQATAPDGTIRPDRRTVCDPTRQLCERDGAPSVARTRYVFGDRAARNLKAQLKD